MKFSLRMSNLLKVKQLFPVEEALGKLNYYSLAIEALAVRMFKRVQTNIQTSLTLLYI